MDSQEGSRREGQQETQVGELLFSAKYLKVTKGENGLHKDHFLSSEGKIFVAKDGTTLIQEPDAVIVSVRGLTIYAERGEEPVFIDVDGVPKKPVHTTESIAARLSTLRPGESFQAS